MTITYRGTKGSALTYDELDGNFENLDGRVSTLENQTLDTRITAIEDTPKIPVFANATARDAAITLPENGIIVLTNNVLQVYNGSWINL